MIGTAHQLSIVDWGRGSSHGIDGGSGSESLFYVRRLFLYRCVLFKYRHFCARVVKRCRLRAHRRHSCSAGSCGKISHQQILVAGTNKGWSHRARCGSMPAVSSGAISGGKRASVERAQTTCRQRASMDMPSLGRAEKLSGPALVAVKFIRCTDHASQAARQTSGF